MYGDHFVMILLEKDMKKYPSQRQLKYARGIMDWHKNKRQVALEAGFSESTARVPKQIENKLGFKLAVAQLAGEVGNVAMKVMYELQARDLSQYSNKELMQCLDVMSKTHERFSQRLEATKPFTY
jgi:hypothetical protein